MAPGTSSRIRWLFTQHHRHLYYYQRRRELHHEQQAEAPTCRRHRHQPTKEAPLELKPLELKASTTFPRESRANSSKVAPSSRGTMRASSELLLDAKVRQLLAEQEERRLKFLELSRISAEAAQRKKLKPRRTCKQRLIFYATSTLALAAISGGCALLFLVPLYVDPAISTLSADFFPEPVLCTTTKREELWGLFNCTWSSCREGCTSEYYRCTHIYVSYTPWSNYSEDSAEGEPDPVDGVLLVNIKGCGYPPAVDCDNFTRDMGQEGSQFPCYYSRVNGSVVMAEYDRQAEVDVILHYFALPLVTTLATTALLCLMHCDCSCQPPPSRRYRNNRRVGSSSQQQPHQQQASRPDDLRYWWLCFHLCKCIYQGGFRIVGSDS
ncbi:unnamed protein product [Trichogramma brassicae]|uniref:Protein tipE n=1 Tax=Trichogramma brassicae TaxID=86971 RepID=A0A6H5I4A6_9HYME|nr:unnamed protein product [Trichogramma brassicae]